jgi:tetratricopeptide (TPR) repeat protein
MGLDGEAHGRSIVASRNHERMRKPTPSPSSQSLHAAERLAAEFEAGRFDSAITRHLLAGSNPFPRLLRACFLAEQGQLEQARADVDAALAHARANPVVEMVAGSVCYATHDYQRALELFADAATRSPAAARRARQLAISAAIALGWDHDVRELLERASAEDPTHASWHAQAVRACARGHWREQALHHAERALALAPDNPTLWMEVAGMYAQLGQPAPTIAALDRALALGPEAIEQRSSYLREAGRVAVVIGEIDRARACFDELLALDPTQIEVHVALAELASWADADSEAREHAERALAHRPAFAPALRMLGALELRAGHVERARELLDTAIANDPSDYQAHVWLTELDLRAGNYEAAHARLHHAVSQSGGYLVVASLLRYLVVAYDEPAEPGELVAYNRTDEFEDVLRVLAPELAEQGIRTRDPEQLIAAVEAALAALRGNRSIHITHMPEGRLTRVHGETGCRHRSRRALQLLRVAPPELCLAELDAVERDHPHSSLPLCHRGELHLWLGNWAQARADLEAAIERVTGTRWAYMGLSTLDLLAGEPERALAINAKGVEVMRESEGLAIHVFRGEALRQLGQLDKAIPELERAVAAHPARASAVINLALAHAAAGQHEQARALWHRLAHEQACGLISDAARELAEGRPLARQSCMVEPEPISPIEAARRIVGDRDWQPTLEVIVAVLERALKMMGGNRSSGLLTYWTSDGRLRFVQQWPHGSPSPHAGDTSRLAQAKKLLVQALASR